MNVFISHSSADKKWAELLREKLAEQGIDVWNSREEMPPGANWALLYGKALENSDAMIVLLSPDSAKSDSVRHEIDYALTAPRFRNRLISLVVRPTREIPWILERQPHFIRAQKDVDATVRDVAGALKTRRKRSRQ
jgi:hypothetical protein